MRVPPAVVQPPPLLVTGAEDATRGAWTGADAWTGGRVPDSTGAVGMAATACGAPWASGSAEAVRLGTAKGFENGPSDIIMRSELQADATPPINATSAIRETPPHRTLDPTRLMTHPPHNSDGLH
jgi:hypothetical protein